MPTAKFEADFSSFLTGVDAAMKSMNAFDLTAQQTEKTLDGMTADFSGRKLIEEATLMTVAVSQIGGASKLTADELEHVGEVTGAAVEKMKALGYEVPQGIQNLADAAKSAKEETAGFGDAWNTMTGYLGAFGIQATVSGLVNFVRELVSGAAEIKTLGDRLSVTTTQVQQFQDLAKASGVSMEAVSNAVQTLQQKLGAGDTGLQKSLTDLKLNFADIKAESPWNAFMDVATALGKMKDANDRADDAAKAMGRTSKELMPLYKTLADGYTDNTVKITDASAKWADSEVQKWNKIWTNIKRNTTEGLAASMDADHAAKNLKALVDSIEPPKNLDFEKTVKQLESVGLSSEQAQRMVTQLTKEFNDSQKASAEYAKAVDAITVAGDGYVTVLDTIDGKVVEAIKWYRSQGVTMNELKQIYSDLTDQQLAAADKAAGVAKKQDEQRKQDLKFYDDLVKKDNAAYDELTKARNAFSDFENKQFQDSTTYKINKIYEEAEVAKQKYTEKYGYSKEYNDYVDSLAAERVRVESEAYDKVVQKAADSYTQMANIAAGMTQTMIDAVQQQLDGVLGAFVTVGHAADDLKAKFAADLAPGPAGPVGGLPSNPEAGSLTTDPRITGLLSEGYTLGEALAIVNGYGGSIVKPVSRQSGTGGGYFGGGSGTTNITINGSVLGNKDEIARVVGAALSDSYKRTGNLFPGY